MSAGVIDLLKKAGDCGGVFGGNIKPWEVAEDMATGTRFGNIVFDKLEPGVSAQASQDAGSASWNGHEYEFFKGIITINYRTDGTKYWSGAESTDLNRAKILIHELGHIFNLVTGLGGSQFKGEINPDGSVDMDKENFNKGLEDKCLKP